MERFSRGSNRLAPTRSYDVHMPLRVPSLLLLLTFHSSQLPQHRHISRKVSSTWRNKTFRISFSYRNFYFFLALSSFFSLSLLFLSPSSFLFFQMLFSLLFFLLSVLFFFFFSFFFLFTPIRYRYLSWHR